MSYSPEEMAMAAFTGISMYIGVEVGFELLFVFSRWSGLYFWSCAICALGVLTQPLFIALADFDIWTYWNASITMIYLTWIIMVVPQSWILYSRLHLVVYEKELLRWIMVVLICTSIILTVPTVVVGVLEQTSDESLASGYSIWSRVEMTFYVVQESVMNGIYIWKARAFLRSGTHLSSDGSNEQSQVMRHLMFANLLVIALDAVLLGIEYASLFDLQGSFKPLVYGIKLKVEFAILNRLVKSVQGPVSRKRSGAESGNIWLGNDNPWIGGDNDNTWAGSDIPTTPKSKTLYTMSKTSSRPEVQGDQVGMVPVQSGPRAPQPVANQDGQAILS